jgi:hypothetical protein
MPAPTHFVDLGMEHWVRATHVLYVAPHPNGPGAAVYLSGSPNYVTVQHLTVVEVVAILEAARHT